MVNEPRPRTRMIRTRSHMLTFRVTEEEFGRLQQASNHSGARCLSDYLRQAALEALHRFDAGTPAREHAAADVTPWVNQRFRSFEERVNQLEMRILTLLGTAPVRRLRRPEEE